MRTTSILIIGEPEIGKKELFNAFLGISSGEEITNPPSTTPKDVSVFKNIREDSTIIISETLSDPQVIAYCVNLSEDIDIPQLERRLIALQQEYNPSKIIIVGTNADQIKIKKNQTRTIHFKANGEIKELDLISSAQIALKDNLRNYADKVCFLSSSDREDINELLDILHQILTNSEKCFLRSFKQCSKNSDLNSSLHRLAYLHYGSEESRHLMAIEVERMTSALFNLTEDTQRKLAAIIHFQKYCDSLVSHPSNKNIIKAAALVASLTLLTVCGMIVGIAIGFGLSTGCWIGLLGLLSVLTHPIGLTATVFSSAVGAGLGIGCVRKYDFFKPSPMEDCIANVAKEARAVVSLV